MLILKHKARDFVDILGKNDISIGSLHNELLDLSLSDQQPVTFTDNVIACISEKNMKPSTKHLQLPAFRTATTVKKRRDDYAFLI